MSRKSSRDSKKANFRSRPSKNRSEKTPTRLSSRLSTTPRLPRGNCAEVDTDRWIHIISQLLRDYHLLCGNRHISQPRHKGSLRQICAGKAVALDTEPCQTPCVFMPILISRYTEGQRTFLLRWIRAGHGCESSEAKTGTR